MSSFTFGNVFKTLNDHYRPSDEKDIFQSIIDDREQEQGDNETDKNNDNGNNSFVIELANVNNDEIIRKKEWNQSEELPENLLTIQETLHNLIQSAVDYLVNIFAGAKKRSKWCNSAEDRLRREKVKQPILPGCLRVEESKKDCVKIIYHRKAK